MPITVTRLQSISIILITSLFFAGLLLIHYKRAVMVMSRMNWTRALMIKNTLYFPPLCPQGMSLYFNWLVPVR